MAQNGIGKIPTKRRGINKITRNVSNSRPRLIAPAGHLLTAKSSILTAAGLHFLENNIQNSMVHVGTLCFDQKLQKISTFDLSPIENKIGEHIVATVSVEENNQNVQIADDDKEKTADSRNKRKPTNVPNESILKNRVATPNILNPVDTNVKPSLIQTEEENILKDDFDLDDIMLYPLDVNCDSLEDLLEMYGVDGNDTFD